MLVATLDAPATTPARCAFEAARKPHVCAGLAVRMNLSMRVALHRDVSHLGKATIPGAGVPTMDSPSTAPMPPSCAIKRNPVASPVVEQAEPLATAAAAMRSAACQDAWAETLIVAVSALRAAEVAFHFVWTPNLPTHVLGQDISAARDWVLDTTCVTQATVLVA